MNNSQSNIIREIAQELDCGNDCYYNSRTNEIFAIPNFLQVMDEEEFKESFRVDLEKIEKHKTEFIKIEVLKSSESFKIMERFVEQMSEQKFKSELENILARKNPFQNFKYKINHSDCRNDWFKFKQSELEKIIRNQLNR